MKNAAIREDGILLRYIRGVGVEIMKSMYREIQWLWENPAHRWNEEHKVRILIPLHMTGDKKDMNNFR